MPQHILSRIAGKLAESRLPWLKNALINYFIKRYAVNLQEAIEPNPFNYHSFNHFFTRALHPSLRPMVANANQAVSPADGIISQYGLITKGSIIQAKNHNYTAATLLGGNNALAAHFHQGAFLTIYLAPKDYHRVHMPYEGKLVHMVYVPGKLFSVNTETANTIPGLFAINERMIAIFETAVGKMAVVMVGAMLVGSIETVWTGTLTPKTTTVQEWDYNTGIHLQKGDELARFKLGSTVIVLFEHQAFEWQAFVAEQSIRYGQTIGTFTS